ncbi:hypothetical protein C7S18_01940 [Ahniella affigens]|uniref:DUF4189 domain-containing protein n=1 Tax=Ahniella affigens TaxID=2021234 RepID=A0A2P1PMH6_9GAMM|nr:hypothetical protein [Ahniella affigens]AVP96027.1 hypothetical protein C7S18_01940 [Ahniella affigens]
MKTLKLAGVIAALAFAGSSVAGSFEVWSDNDKSMNKVVVVSFAGDNETQDAMLDLEYPANWEFVKAAAKASGTICAAKTDERKIRIVPPSGAGKALGGRADYCTFLFKPAAGKAAGGALKTLFTECAAANGNKTCSADLVDLNEK